MPRLEIDKATVRSKLAPRREPYWGPPVERGLYVGFRRLEQGGNWIARLRNEDGRQVYNSLGAVSATNDLENAKKEARRWAKNLEAGIQADVIETVAEGCSEYVKWLRLSKRDAAADDAARRFARTVDQDPLGKVKLTKLRESHLVDWKGRLEAGKLAALPVMRGRPAESKPLSPAGVKRTLTALKAALNHAVRKRLIAPEKAHEWREVQPDAEADGRRDLYLDRAQRAKLLAAATDELRDYIECVALTGCRPGDPAGALRKDYDGKSGVVTFRSKKRTRTIPLGPQARALFERLAKAKLPKAHLFAQPNGAAWTADAWGDAVREAVAAAKLPLQTVLYTLRHSWITDAIVGGMDLLTVSKLTGTSLVMIERHYGHLAQAATRDKLETIAFV